MLRTCTYLLVLFTFYSFYGGHNLSKAAPTEPPEKQVTTTTTSGGFSASEIAGTSIGVISLLVGVFGLISTAILSYSSQKKVLKANIVENNDGTLSCDVMFGGERLTDNVIYRWFPTDEPNERQTSELPQQKLVFDSDQKFRCEVEYTGTCSRIWNCCKSRKATSNTLDVKKKDLVAKIENSDDDSLICEVTLDNEPINVAYLTYKWYENEKEMPQETQKQLQQRQSMFMSKQNYKCVVVYKRGNISIKASDTLTVEKKNIIATIEECSDGKLKCNVKKDNERIEDGLTYQWYDGVKELPGETGKFLAQNQVSFESVQKYRCEVKYTASNWDPDVIVKEASNTLKKRLIATIEENEEGSVKCEAKQDDESIHRDDLTYKWYESGKVISGETGQVLPQQRAIFEHNQKYSCAVVYTKGNRQINATSDSLELRKKYITATIDECDDGKLICNVEKDNKRIDDVLTYQWYDGENKLEGETEKKLAKEVSHDSKLRYRCEVKYRALATNVTVMASCIIATIDECDDGKFICNVKKGNECINNGLTYQWYDGVRKLEGETGKQLAQNPVPHDSIQQYRCEVKFTAPTYVVNVTAISGIIATIDECDDGKFICNVEKGNESINDGLTYQWYDGERELVGETGKQLAQNPFPHDSMQYGIRCKVKFTAPTYVVNVTAIEGIIATIDECDDGKFICNVKKGNECIDDGLTYQWYDGERELVGETGKQLAQNPVTCDSIQRYRCEVKFTAPTYVVNVTAIKSETPEKNISATIDECDDGKLICNVEKTILTYQWYDGERRLKGETGKQLAQNSVAFESVQNYKCKVKYTASNWDPDVFVKETSNTLTRFNHVAELHRLYGKLKPCDMRDFGLEGIVLTFMETKYIEVRRDEQADQEKKTNQESIAFKKLKESIFEDAKIWIISGVPGSGKTTSINRLCREWKENDQPHKILILVRLAELNDIERDHCTLRTIIKKAIPCLESDDSYHDEALQRIECEINKYPGKYIFALDGYDEYQKSEEDNFIKKLIKRLMLDKCTVVITTRPYSCENLKKEIKSHSADFTEFKIAPFENIDDFIQQHYVDNAIEDAKEKAKNLTNTVKKHDFLHSLCTLPLHCAMVCSYFDADPSTPPETITELYKFFIEMTTKRHYEKYKNGEGSKDEMLKQVCKLAYEKIAGKGQSVEIDDQSGLGLVVVRSHKKERQASPVKVYEFIHETIKEYLAALHLKGMLNDMPEDDLDSIIKDEKNSEVLKFLCGLTKDVGVFKNIVNTESGDIMYWIQCAYEVQKKDVCDHVMSQLVTEGNVDVGWVFLSPSDCAAIFKVLEPSQVRCLNLDWCHIGPEGARLLKGGLKKCSKLEQLSLSWNNIGDEGVKHISVAIKESSSLEVLDLSCNNIGEEGAKHISVAIKESSSLKVLRLRSNNIGDKGAEHISVAIKESSSLEVLDLRGNEIGYEGAKHISVAIKESSSSSLEQLKLSYNFIGEKGKGLLMTAKESINLKRMEARRPLLTLI